MLKNAILTAFYSKKWYWLVYAWLEFLQECVSVLNKHCLTIFWLESMFLNLWDSLNSEKCQFYGILRLFMAWNTTGQCLLDLNSCMRVSQWQINMVWLFFDQTRCFWVHIPKKYHFYGTLRLFTAFLRKIPTEFFVSCMVISV